jgi:hypothetical protein
VVREVQIFHDDLVTLVGDDPSGGPEGRRLQSERVCR